MHGTSSGNATLYCSFGTNIVHWVTLRRVGYQYVDRKMQCDNGQWSGVERYALARLAKKADKILKYCLLNETRSMHQ